jgi:hypothetical protein
MSSFARALDSSAADAARPRSAPLLPLLPLAGGRSRGPVCH